MTNTTRLALTYPPVAGTSTADVPTDMQTFLNQIDTLMMAWQSGTFAGRPAASAMAGKTYWATDYKRSYISDGTNWYDIQPPVGQIIAFPSSTPPDATWLPCDGSSQLRASYPALFGLIGTVYGSVDGTHFNVPDLRGRTIFGVDAGAGRIVTDPHTIASSGGEERHLLLSTESGNAAANTGNDSPDHIHDTQKVIGFNPSVSGSGASGYLWGVATGFDFTAGANTRHQHPINAQNAANSHENMPPYLTLAWMIKT